MIQFEISTKPFISDDTCGDFALHLNCDSSDLICIGDVGGHGNSNVHHISQEVINVVSENRDLNISYIFDKVKNLESVKKYGLVFFLGRINKNLGVLSYICVGNLKVNIISNDEVRNLDVQQGILGLQIPQNLTCFILKLKPEEIIIVSTDGVNNYEKNILEIYNTDFQNRPKEFIDFIIDKYAHKDDDALTCLIKFKQTGLSYNNAYKPPLEILDKKLDNTILNKNNSKKEKFKDINITKVKNNAYKKLEELDEASYFSTINNSLLSREKLFNICYYFQFSKVVSIKLQTIILELLKYETTDITLYVSNNIFQMKTTISEELLKSISYLFNFGNYSYSKKNNNLILQFHFNSNIDITSNEFLELKEMLKFGLDKESYKVFKKDKDKDKLLTQQSKLAAMGEMIGAIAHQWRQPLNTLSIRVQKLEYAYKKNKIDDKYIEDYVNKNTDTINFMSKTIDDFRNFFRVDKKKALFNIKESILDIIEMQSAQLNNHNIKIQVEGKNFEYLGFKSEFQQVILNLVSNSKDAIVERNIDNGLINISLKNNTIILTDNGGGIKEDIIHRIFEPYFTTKEQGKGSGMGLYMSKKIIEDNLKGHITIKNIENGTEAIINLNPEENSYE